MMKPFALLLARGLAGALTRSLVVFGWFVDNKPWVPQVALPLLEEQLTSLEENPPIKGWRARSVSIAALKTYTYTPARDRER